MSIYEITTPSRLHLGLLATAPSSPRRFGGVGMMIDRPNLRLSARMSRETKAVGPLWNRALSFYDQISKALLAQGVEIPPIRFEIQQAPPPHAGFGSGTQLGLAVARLTLALAEQDQPSISDLAKLTGRGLRSGIGLHGFAHGGLLVDGGRKPSQEQPPPLIVRQAWPEEWAVLVIVPPHRHGLHGEEEAAAFAKLPPASEALTDRLCSLVLLGLLPALIERDLDAFGCALSELQHHIGAWFASVQGGSYAHPSQKTLVDWLQNSGLKGVGQSSWGPALYGFSDESVEARSAIVEEIRERFDLKPTQAFWTIGNNQGASMIRLGV